ncbi:MAG: PQQ-binding-like beta-propeller repeat protein [Acidobacteriota bacterium]|nr:PQQ-binding-like beta-propeller repeat protein [Acidobacteriota bacterium]
MLADSSNWTTFSGDQQRTGQVRNETDLTKESVPHLKLLWKTKLDNKSSELSALTVPVVASYVYAPGGIKDFVIVAGSDNNVYSLDGESGKIDWQKHFQAAGIPIQNAYLFCPNTLNATPVIDREKLIAYVLASDGKLHSLRVVNGEDDRAPREFTPPFAKTWSLNLANGMIYTSSSNGCNSVPSSIFGIDESSTEVKKFFVMHAYGGGIWGRAGLAIGPDGTIYAGTGDGSYDPAKEQYPDSVLAVDGHTLQLKDYFTPQNNKRLWKKDLDMGGVSPTVFPYKNKELVAASGKEGVIFLLDSKAMGGADHMTPLYASEMVANANGDFSGHGVWGAFSTWQDQKSRRWLYAPVWGPPTGNVKFPISYGEAAQGSIMAFEVTGPAEKPVLTPAWQSVNMSIPEPVVIANGVVFALASGDNPNQTDPNGTLYKSDFRSTHPSGHEIVYAMDAETGKVLFSSGDTITGWSHFSGLAVAGGRVYAVTYDDMVYAFGLPD